MLALNNARREFFERQELEAVLEHLPAYAQAPVMFAYITGWRFKSEVLSLTVAQVDLQAGVVRLEVGTTKSKDGRSFYVTEELRKLLRFGHQSYKTTSEEPPLFKFHSYRDNPRGAGCGRKGQRRSRAQVASQAV